MASRAIISRHILLFIIVQFVCVDLSSLIAHRVLRDRETVTAYLNGVAVVRSVTNLV